MTNIGARLSKAKGAAIHPLLLPGIFLGLRNKDILDSLKPTLLGEQNACWIFCGIILTTGNQGVRTKLR
jgi:hypothetical protein